MPKLSKKRKKNQPKLIDVTEIPSAAVLKKMPWPKLYALAQRVQATVVEEYPDAYRIAEVPDAAARRVLNLRNQRALKLIEKSKALTENARFFTKPKDLQWFSLSSDVLAITIPLAVAKRFSLQVIKSYADSVTGYWSTVSFSPTGVVTWVGISDSEDVESFYRAVFEHYARDRAGDGPPVSATIFKEGARFTTRRGKAFTTVKFGKSLRWQVAHGKQ